MCAGKSVYLYNCPYSLKVYRFACAHFSDPVFGAGLHVKLNRTFDQIIECPWFTFQMNCGLQKFYPLYIWSRFILGKKIKWNRNPQKTSNLISGIWSLILNWNDSYLFYKSFGNFLIFEKKIKLWLHFVISGCWLGLLKTFYNNIIRASNYQTIMISYFFLTSDLWRRGFLKNLSESLY